jgi:hypothetical protein
VHLHYEKSSSNKMGSSRRRRRGPCTWLPTLALPREMPCDMSCARMIPPWYIAMITTLRMIRCVWIKPIEKAINLTSRNSFTIFLWTFICWQTALVWLMGLVRSHAVVPSMLLKSRFSCNYLHAFDVSHVEFVIFSNICNTLRPGGYGIWGARLTYNSTCRIRHSSTRCSWMDVAA